MENTLIIVESEPPISIIKLNRPNVLNALSPEMLETLAEALEKLDLDQDIRAIILTGDERVFAAGADIKSMSKAFPIDILEIDTLRFWKRIWNINKPLIAAVSGYVYGGGCELALSCDMIVASETSLFAQPEIKLGVMSGAGGTQRWTKAIGPYRAMEIILTGEPINAQRAYDYGLINRIVPVERYLDEAKELAYQISERPPIAVKLARQALRHGVENTLREGLEIERRNFMLLFDTKDQKEGMKAFLEKRKADFSGR
jgi:enoyl-CoA hydratase